MTPQAAQSTADLPLLRAQGTAIVTPDGEPVRLRGVGLGNWLLPEGYMWTFGPGAESPREIEALVARLAGEEYAKTFWRRFREEFIAEEDIALIAAMGFDHVRLPINARVIQDEAGDPIEAGYALIDRCIAWCRAHGLYVVLDLHGAPGGQTGTNIDDSPRGEPDLFLDPGRYRELTLRLWHDLATRYRDESAVLAYDLLNEPLPNEWGAQFSDDLVALYRDLTATVRAVDPDHILMYEGTHWASDMSIFTERWDDNQVIQFHRYWSPPDRAGIASILDTRDRLQVPVYMGEGGENTPEWLYTAFRLYETEGIGWNFWPWKKIDTVTSPLSIRPPEGWADAVASASGEARLGPERAREVFDAFLDAAAVEACDRRDAVVDALMASSASVVPGWGFGFRGEGESSSGAGSSTLPQFRADDAVAVRFAAEDEGVANPFQQNDGRAYEDNEVLVVNLPAGGWLEYELEDGADPATVEAVDENGACVDVEVTTSARGLKVTAGPAGARIGHLRVLPNPGDSLRS